MQPVGLQEWIHKIEEGEGTKYVRLVFCVLALLGLSALWHLREARNFYSMEAMDGAQVARNIAHGRGFSTQFVRPFSLALLEQHAGDSPDFLRKPHPDLANAPAYPLLLAGLMKMLPFQWEITGTRFWRYQPEVIIGWFNQLLFFVSLFLLFRLARQLFDKAVAALATVLMALTEIYWEFTTSGLSTMLLVFLFLVLAQLLVNFDEGARSGLKSKLWLIGMALAAGVLVGAMAMTRYSMAWLIIPVALYIAFTAMGVRPQAVTAAVTACLLVAAPWLVRNYQLSGTLFGTAGFAIHEGTGTFPGHILERSMPRNIALELNKIDLDQYPRKLFVNARETVASGLPEAAGSWIAAFFLVSLLIQFRNPAISRLKYFLLGTLLLYVLVQALGRTELSADSPRINSENLLVVFTPLFFLFGSGLFYVLLDQIELPAPWLRSFIISLAVTLLSLPMILKLLPPRNSPIAYPPYHPQMHQALAECMQPDELIMSDLPWAVAWYGERQCIWVTLDYGQSTGDDFYRVNDYHKAIKALYLTEVTTDSKFLTQMDAKTLIQGKPENTAQAREGVWGRFYLTAVVMKDIPRGFPLRLAPPSLLPDVLFLSDTETRWSKPWSNSQKKKR